MPHSIAEDLRAINGKLRAVVSNWQSNSSQSTPFTPAIFSDLLADLQRAANLLHGVASDSPPDTPMEEEIADYRRSAQDLVKILPAIHDRLLIDKARLEAARAHLSATAAWMEARKKTL